MHQAGLFQELMCAGGSHVWSASAKVLILNLNRRNGDWNTQRDKTHIETFKAETCQNAVGIINFKLNHALKSLSIFLSEYTQATRVLSEFTSPGISLGKPAEQQKGHGRISMPFFREEILMNCCQQKNQRSNLLWFTTACLQLAANASSMLVPCYKLKSNHTDVFGYLSCFYKN